MNVLELFAGSRSIGKAVEKRGKKAFSVDINDFDDIDYVTEILEFDVEKVPFIPDMIWASPTCTYVSVESIGVHWNKDHTPKSENALLGVKLVEKTLEIIAYFQEKNPNMIWYMENPRGKLRKLPVVRGEFDRATVWYCKYMDSRAKPTDIWTNNLYSIFNDKGWIPRPLCFNGNKSCHHEVAPRGSKTGTQGLKDNYERSKLPEELCLEIITATENKLNLNPCLDEKEQKK